MKLLPQVITFPAKYIIKYEFPEVKFITKDITVQV
jgi:hypothetical protein